MTHKMFTKSAFKQALTCPASMKYYHDSDEYANQNNSDDFLQALADGGNQAGDLAKVYYGIAQGSANDIDVLDYETARRRTDALMLLDEVNIAEAAFSWGNCFVRADIIEKKGKVINLIEVKAKSWDPRKDSFWMKKAKAKVETNIRPYVYDVAFQKYVIQNALGSEYEVRAFLMMADKSVVSTAECVNQHFHLVTDGHGRNRVERDETADTLRTESHVLVPFPVDDVCTRIIEGTTAEQMETMGCTFKEFVGEMSERYVKEDWTLSPVSDRCFKCPFFSNDKTPGMKDGRKECWTVAQHFTEADFAKPSVSELWCGQLGNNPVKKKLVESGKFFMDQISEEDIPVQDAKAGGLSPTERRILQVALTTGNDAMLEPFRKNMRGEAYIDAEGLKKEMNDWKYPLHMIDFETTSVALPLYKDMRPYEQVAFQFSHHVIEEDGTIRHEGQWLNTEKHRFPNFEFIRALRDSLSKDNGSVFRYATHENSILRAIHAQLKASYEKDKKELMEFIDSITHYKVGSGKSEVTIAGKRDMIDLLEVVKRYFYHPSMKGSNSIKVVLPAVLKSSQAIVDKYSQPIYGSVIPSLNIPAEDPKSWITRSADGEIENPYKHLDEISAFLGVSTEEAEEFDTSSQMDDPMKGTINNGGIALAAYTKLQFSDERCTGALAEALLRYCELDTMSMVFIWEYFMEATR